MLLVRTRLDVGESVRLYEIFNTSDRAIWVLAKDVPTALAIATTAKHLKHETNGKCYELNLDAAQPGISIHMNMSAVQRAARERVQGVLKSKGNFVEIRDEIFSPISEVK